MAKAAVAAVNVDPQETPVKEQPWHKARLSAMQLAGWQNTVSTNDGDRIYRSFTLARSYQDKDGEWHETKMSLGERDLGAAIALLQNAQQALVKVGQ